MKKTIAIPLVSIIVAIGLGIAMAVAGVVLRVNAARRERERRVQVANNLKKIGEALLQYSGEDSGFFVAPPDGRDLLDDSGYGVPGTSAPPEVDLVIMGTIEKLEIASGENLLDATPCLVQCRVDQVISGTFTEETFSFRIHSPAKAGLEKGKQYRITAMRTKDGWVVDPFQWLSPGAANQPQQ